MNAYTMTSTRVDVRRVVECFAADLSMLVIRTQAKNVDSEWAKKTARDIELMAIERCLTHVHIQLRDSEGALKAAHKYTVQEDGGSNGDRPSNNNWPAIHDGFLRVIVSYSDVERVKILNESGKLNFKWVSSDDSTEYGEMKLGEALEYSSNAYKWRRDSYKEKER